MILVFSHDSPIDMLLLMVKLVDPMTLPGHGGPGVALGRRASGGSSRGHKGRVLGGELPTFIVFGGWVLTPVMYKWTTCHHKNPIARVN